MSWAAGLGDPVKADFESCGEQASSMHSLLLSVIPHHCHILEMVGGGCIFLQVRVIVIK